MDTSPTGRGRIARAAATKKRAMGRGIKRPTALQWAVFIAGLLALVAIGLFVLFGASPARGATSAPSPHVSSDPGG